MAHGLSRPDTFHRLAVQGPHHEAKATEAGATIKDGIAFLKGPFPANREQARAWRRANRRANR